MKQTADALLAENQRLRDEYEYWRERAHDCERILREALAGDAE